MKKDIQVDLATDELRGLGGAAGANSVVLCSFSCQATCTCQCGAPTLGQSCNATNCVC